MELNDIRIHREDGIYNISQRVQLGSRQAWLHIEETNDYHRMINTLVTNNYGLITWENGYSYYRKMGG